ncbi:hypothetical protein AMECASPLE_031791 [Ameca splendens]|uniref:Secreted protein n=1 Tax=Ameca splendens TaxID=208324 RepID=A0ABV0ZF61_9TELE
MWFSFIVQPLYVVASSAGGLYEGGSLALLRLSVLPTVAVQAELPSWVSSSGTHLLSKLDSAAPGSLPCKSSSVKAQPVHPSCLPGTSERSSRFCAGSRPRLVPVSPPWRIDRLLNT